MVLISVNLAFKVEELDNMPHNAQHTPFGFAGPQNQFKQGPTLGFGQQPPSLSGGQTPPIIQQPLRVTGGLRPQPQINQPIQNHQIYSN